MDLHFTSRPSSHAQDSARPIDPHNPSSASAHRSSNTSHTLPPLQPQRSTMPQPMYGYASNASHGSRPMNPTSMPMTSSSTLPHLAPHPSLTDLQAHQAAYEHPSFSSSTPILTAPANNFPNHHPIVPAPNSRLPVPLRPMPSGGLNSGSQQPMPQGFDHTQMMPSDMQGQDPLPTHVVGSQGRRGILPSAPGRAAAVAGAGTTAKNVTPMKDSDGKYPCPHCNKTYLHAKHLKRHLLRHTGDRPYMCFLCKDTFSRSDILKRHFQKCSLRRGNPTGASHLAHSQAHIKKLPSGSQGPAGSTMQAQDFASSLNYVNGMDDNGLGAALAGGGTHAKAPQHLLHTNSAPNGLGRHHSDDGLQRGSLTGLGPGPSSSNRSSVHGGHDRDAGINMAGFDALPTSIADTSGGHSRFPQHFDFEHRNSLPGGLGGTTREPDHALDYYNGVQPGNNNHLDWSMLQGHSNEHPVNPMFHADGDHGHPGVKFEHSMNGGTFDSVGTDHDGIFNSLYPTPSTLGGEAMPNVGGDFSNWNLELSQIDPLHNKSLRLVSFCFPQDVVEDHHISDNLRNCLTAENVKHHIELFTNFQGHWPIIHVPSFNFTEAYDGLVMAMVCIGAVYSDRLDVDEVRELMERVEAGIQRSSRLLGRVKREGSEGFHPGHFSSQEAHAHVEELQALFLMQMLFTWHGNSRQREHVRHAFTDTVGMARKAGLLEPCGPESPAYSMLHQATLPLDQQDLSAWDWREWVEQEKRIRVMYNIFLLDTAFVIYFNVPPRIDSFEIYLPLPADDAAWDAKSAGECADALGLHGADVQQRVNTNGSRRMRQPDMHSALKALLQPMRGYENASTNVYAKFILIHALHVQMWRAQRHMPQNLGDQGFSGSNPSTPGLQGDRMSKSFDDRSSYSGNTNSSGYVTPTEGIVATSPGPQHLLKATNDAIEKWKHVWDKDWAMQYPLSGSNLRRFGFCRDGVHFFWLARLFVNRWRPYETYAAPDTRFMQVLRLLKHVQQFVASDTAQRGEEIGSVGDIDQAYGMDDLALDMKLLFKPINEEVDSPVSGVQTNVSNQMV
ncbi:MAG: hypothetical protein M4579_003707 [Chaenotheca gracillima]|nr:MAG: hypothetical protein M4579_003707 [Chaenotheca gracillima]